MSGNVMHLAINTKLCPFCKQNNHCVIGSCWCYKSNVPSELSELVPSPLKRKSCICRACVDLFNKNPLQFLKQFRSR